MKNNEAELNINFQKLLDKFHKIIADTPKPEKVKSQLEELKSESTVAILTGPQRDAISARCKNYLSANYGSTSKSYSVHNHQK